MSRKTRVIMALAPIGAIALAGVLYSESGEAAPEETSAETSALSGTVTLRDVATQFCLDSNTSGNAYTLGCNGGSFQKWTVINRSGSVVSLKNLATGLCLDSNTSGNAYTLGCNGGNFQNWTVINRGGSVITLKDVSTGFCLDSNTSRNLYTHSCNGGSFQNWSR
jgi:Ricin-type beta-trefoil lectin domain